MSVDLVTAMGRLMKNWPGRALNAQGTLRILNESGSRQPLFWILNAAQDTPHFEEAFGPDQPVIYGRSLHLLVPRGEDTTVPAKTVADHYTKTLTEVLSPGQIWLGANCQANSVVRQLLPCLQTAGYDVAALTFVNNPLLLENTGLPAMLIYGDKDDHNNPFAQDMAEATERANAAFSSYEKRMVAAGHGQYFSPPVIHEIVEVFRAFWAQQSSLSEGATPAKLLSR